MKKLRTLCFILLIPVLISLTACGKAPEAAAPTPNHSPAELMPTPTPFITPEPSPTPPAAQDYLSLFLSALPHNTQPGSSGCSLKAAAQAAALLDRLTAEPMNSEELYNITAAFMEELSEADKELYSSALGLLNEALLSLAGPGQEELLMSAGCANALYPWSEDVHAMAGYIMLAAGQRQEQNSAASADGESGVYAPLIDAYYAALSAPDPVAALQAAGLNAGLSGYITAHPLSSLGYCLHDINADGSRELLIGPLTEPYLALDIYTLLGNQAIPVFRGTAGNVCAVTKDGTLFNYVILDSQRFAYNFFSLTPQGLSFSGGLTHDSVYAPANPWYESADMDMQVYNDTPCHSSAAQEKINSAMASAIVFDYEAFALMHR